MPGNVSMREHVPWLIICCHELSLRQGPLNGDPPAKPTTASARRGKSVQTTSTSPPNALGSPLECAMPIWAWLTPALSLGLLIASMVTGVGPLVAVLCGISLVGTVIAGVHHAEVVA